MDWLDLLAVQGTLKSLLQHHSSKASILRHSAFFTVQLSHPYMTTGKTIALTKWTLVGKVTSLLFIMLSRLVITFLPRSKRLLELVFLFSSNKYPVVDLLNHVVFPFLIFWGIFILLSIVAASVYTPINSAQGSLFSTSLPALVIYCLFYNNHSDRCEEIPHCGWVSVILISLINGLVVLSIFSCVHWPSICLLW